MQRLFLTTMVMMPLGLLSALGCKSETPGVSGTRQEASTWREQPEPGQVVPAHSKEAAETVVISEAPQPLTEDELADGWISLFDGETLFGWEAATDANWRVEEGTIVVDGGDPGLLCTTTRFGDYVLKVEFRSDPGTNSGVFLHTPRKPTDPAADCYELNIADSDNPYPTCSRSLQSQ